MLTYPFMKRFFPMPQFYLGIAFTWSVPMAFAAQTGTMPPRLAWVLFLAGLLWTMAYDTMYAMVDREDDRKLGIRSSAILFGDADRFIIGVMQLMSLFALWLAGRELKLGLWYGLGLAFAAMFALYQQLLIRERKPEECLRAFLNNNYFGMSVFIGIALDYLFTTVTCVLAIAQTTTCSAPASRRTRASSLTVLPVVTTSSRIAMRRARAGAIAAKAPLTFCRRALRFKPACSTVSRCRIATSVIRATAVTSAIASASSVAWL